MRSKKLLKLLSSAYKIVLLLPVASKIQDVEWIDQPLDSPQNEDDLDDIETFETFSEEEE